MARIVVQTDDRRTVLEEPDIQLADVSDARTRLQLMGRLQAAVGDAERSRPPPAGQAPADDPAGRRLPRGQRLSRDSGVTASARRLRPRRRGRLEFRLKDGPLPGYARGRLQTDQSKETGPRMQPTECARRAGRMRALAAAVCAALLLGLAVAQTCPSGPGRAWPARQRCPDRPAMLVGIVRHSARTSGRGRPNGVVTIRCCGQQDARRLLPRSPPRRPSVARHLRTALRRRGRSWCRWGSRSSPRPRAGATEQAASSEGPRYEFTISSPRGAPRLASARVRQLLFLPARPRSPRPSAKASATRSRLAKAARCPARHKLLRTRHCGSCARHAGGRRSPAPTSPPPVRP